MFDFFDEVQRYVRYTGTQPKIFQRSNIFGQVRRYRGTQGTQLKNFQRAQHFWPGTEVQRYTDQNFSEQQHFWPGTEVQRYTARFLCCASDNFEKNFDFFDEVQKYARYTGTCTSCISSTWPEILKNV